MCVCIYSDMRCFDTCVCPYVCLCWEYTRIYVFMYICVYIRTYTLITVNMYAPQTQNMDIYLRFTQHRLSLWTYILLLHIKKHTLGARGGSGPKY